MGAAVAGAALAALVFEQMTGQAWVTHFLARHPSAKVVAAVPAAAGPRRRVVLFAHYDTQRAGLVWNRLTTTYLAPVLARLPGPLKTPLFPVTAAMAGQVLLGPAAALWPEAVPVGPVAGVLLGVYAVAATLLGEWAVRGFVPDASDNASGVAAVLALAERWAADPAGEVELVVLLTGCEETGLLGAAAWCGRHRDEPDRVPTVFLNVDSLGSGPPQFPGCEVPMAGWPVRYPDGMVRAGGEVAAAGGWADAGRLAPSAVPCSGAVMRYNPPTVGRAGVGPPHTRIRESVMRVRSLLFAAAVALLGTGCRTDEPAPARRVIGVSLLSLTNPFFTEIADNLRDEAAKHGYEVLVVSGENDVARQNHQVQDFVVRRVDAIVLSPCDSKAIGESIRAANAAGVPVFTVDIACLDPGAEVVAHVATDNYAGGRQAADAIREALGGRGGRGGRVGVLDYKEVESCLLRVKGFKDALAEHNRRPGAARIEIVSELPCAGARDRGYKAMEDMLQAHADLAAVFAINDLSALGARAALEKAGRDRVKLIGFDGQPEGKRAIGEGKIYADPIQYPDRIGRTAAATIARYFDGHEVEKEVLIPTGLYRKADAVREGLAP